MGAYQNIQTDTTENNNPRCATLGIGVGAESTLGTEGGEVSRHLARKYMYENLTKSLKFARYLPDKSFIKCPRLLDSYVGVRGW